ncbi:hypothetical protein [Pseudomonas sp. GV071]|uniref:hypothetical protein n=1 Tax=Pseudomonas sp. GV071 TaxID=2135754 RepID=UPI000D3C2905|nr:hypothetical protein [Pseudomonas sp. GV071]PTQ69041.1 hypothetical protein C8K61_10960 [Pseudomonas sp. GV071]
MDVHSRFSRCIARLLVGVLVANPLLSTAAELAVDAAGSATSITQAANGVPVVNIATLSSNFTKSYRYFLEVRDDSY